MRKYFNFFLPHIPLLTLCKFYCYSNNSFFFFFCFRFQQVVSILELIVDVVGSYVSLVGLLRRLIGTCRAIWSVCTARKPAAVANDPQNEAPPTDAEESNIWSLRFQEDLSCTCNTTFTTFTVHNMQSLLFQVALLCVTSKPNVLSFFFSLLIFVEEYVSFLFRLYCNQCVLLRNFISFCLSYYYIDSIIFIFAHVCVYFGSFHY